MYCPMPGGIGIGVLVADKMCIRDSTQAELLENAREFRERKLPIDMIVQDWQYWGKYGWNAMKFDEDRYPDPGSMMKELHEMDVRLMLSLIHI